MKSLRGNTSSSFFYPRADTPGCTIEACEFRDSYKQMQKTGAVLLGISPDQPKAQKKFKRNSICLFRCWAMPKRRLEAYRSDEGKEHVREKGHGVARTTFVIGPDGKIQHISRKLSPKDTPKKSWPT